MARLFNNCKLRIFSLFLGVTTSAFGSGIWDPYTGVGFSGMALQNKDTDFGISASAATGKVGYLSYLGSLDAGYRFKDQSAVLRGSLEFYVFVLGLYSGLETHFKSNTQSDLGITYGLAFWFPVKGLHFRLRAGGVALSEKYSGEIQAMFSVLYAIN